MAYSSVFDKLKDFPNYIKRISNITTDYSDLIDQNRIGVKEKSKDIIDMTDDMGMTDILRGLNSKERGDIPYFSKAYANRVNQLMIFASNPEIEFIVHSIANDAISTEENNAAFCKPVVDIPTLKQEIKDKIQIRFNKIYAYYGFNDQNKTSAWAYFVRWLIEGFLAFEIIYDDKDNPKEIIGFEERDASSLIPLKVIDKTAKTEGDGKENKKIIVWRQIVKDEGGRETVKTIPDNSMIFIAYNRMPGSDGRFSYVERLIRSFNLKRTMENTSVAWRVSNSQFRMKLILPVGTKTTNKAKQVLAAVTNQYKEDLTIDHNSGEVQMNGQPLINFGKTFVLPSRNGQEPKIEAVTFGGPDLSNMDTVKHFGRNLERDSTLPHDRFDHDKGGGTSFIFNSDLGGIPNDEKNYFKNLNRLRRQFDAILTRPLYLQTLMDYPALKEDMEFKNKLCMAYESDNLYVEAKEEEIESHKMKRINDYIRLTEINGSTPLYSRKYLVVNKFKLMTENDWKENERMKKLELDAAKVMEDKATKEAETDINTPPAGDTEEKLPENDSDK